MEKSCEVCHVIFTAQRPNRARFCSETCRSRFHRHGISILTPDDMKKLQQARTHLREALGSLDSVNVTRAEEMKTLSFIRDALSKVQQRLSRRMDIEARHGAYDPTGLRDAS